MDDRTLPELSEALLDAETLDALLRDLAELTAVDEVLLKGAPQAMATEAQRDVRSIGPLLTGRQLRGAQVRYRYEDQNWCDTLLATDSGVKLVRIRLQAD